jgi:hypothetical protein
MTPTELFFWKEEKHSAEIPPPSTTIHSKNGISVFSCLAQNQEKIHHDKHREIRQWAGVASSLTGGTLFQTVTLLLPKSSPEVW